MKAFLNASPASEQVEGLNRVLLIHFDSNLDLKEHSNLTSRQKFEFVFSVSRTKVLLIIWNQSTGYQLRMFLADLEAKRTEYVGEFKSFGSFDNNQGEVDGACTIASILNECIAITKIN